MKQIIPGIHYFTGLMTGRVYLIEDPDGLTLVDAGLPPSPPKIMAQFKAAGYRADQVKRILITHAHADHIGGLPELKRLTGAQVYASAAERPAVEGQAATPRPDPATVAWPARLIRLPAEPLPGTPVDHVLADGEILPEVLGGLTALVLFGHTPGHLVFWQAERRILFCGDALMRLGSGLRRPFGWATVNMPQAVADIGRLAALQPEVICPGHGNAVTHRAAEALDRLARQVGAGG